VGHYERPKLRTQTYPRAHTDTHVTTSEGETEKDFYTKRMVTDTAEGGAGGDQTQALIEKTRSKIIT